MAAFKDHHGTLAVYDADQVDTDRIIPARFLTMVTKSGYGDLLFKDVRGEDFPLDQPAAFGASLLVVGTNFGCGSSREHAVWAIQQAGFVAVIAKITEETSGYSDIFRQNAANCGLLLVELPEDAHATLVGLGSGTSVTIDLPNQVIMTSHAKIAFEMNSATKSQMLAGLDLVGVTLADQGKILEFEKKWDSFRPDPVP